MNRFTLRFAGADVEAAFAQEQARKAVRPARIASPFLCALIVGDYVLTTHVFKGIVVGIGALNMLYATIGALATGALFYALTYRPVFLRRQQLIMFLAACLGSVAITWMTARLPFEILESRGFTFMLIYVFFIYSVFRLRFPQAVLAGWLGTAFLVGYLFGLDLLGPTAAGRTAFILGMANCGGMLICYQMDVAARREFTAMRLFAKEREHSERLLLNILPANVIQELAVTGKVKPARHEDASILFTDFASFTQTTSTMPADRMVAELNDIFVAFDEIAQEEGIEKIKTIGDAYMAAAGLSDGATNHAERCVRAALRMTKFMEERNRTATFKWHLRVGIHSGPVISGVVGKHKYAYDIWGDAVNIASRMESAGEAGQVNISAYTYDLVRSMFPCTYRGKINAKGKGDVDMYFVDTTKNAIVA